MFLSTVLEYNCEDFSKACLKVLNEKKDWLMHNNTLISLIPKSEGAGRVGEFRPISLCNVLYKLIVKCITNRMKLVLLAIIFESQSDFISRRLISDNTLVAFKLYTP